MSLWRYLHKQHTFTNFYELSNWQYLLKRERKGEKKNCQKRVKGGDFEWINLMELIIVITRYLYVDVNFYSQ